MVTKEIALKLSSLGVIGLDSSVLKSISEPVDCIFRTTTHETRLCIETFLRTECLKQSENRASVYLIKQMKYKGKAHVNNLL